VKIGFLTSSRADYSIYLPLLKQVFQDDFFFPEIIAFGSHLSPSFGYTVKAIENDGFIVQHKIENTIAQKDSPEAIADAIGIAISKFSGFWRDKRFDKVVALGDRYEMFAACIATVPFNMKVAHIHGGEETLGAIDNVFRNSITQVADLHFTSTEIYRQRVIAIKNSQKDVYNTGALSLDNLKSLRLYNKEEFFERIGIDINKPSILFTFHPETVSFEKNEFFIEEIIAAFKSIENYQFIITMPNADTLGNLIRKKLEAFIEETPHAFGIESFGTIGYLTAMKYCSFLLGNTSSGFGEAAFFPKYVINLGSRQNGRIVTANICSIPISKNAILQAVAEYPSAIFPASIDIYGDGTAAKQIVNILKKSS
jgi:GDP/UDP-N,N'-diacetylbacillosamine 2-epimerase (hydrolysing)